MSLNTTSLIVLTPKDTCSTSQDMELMPRALSAEQRRQFLQRNKLKAKPNAYPVTDGVFVRRANCYLKADRVKCTKFCVYQFGRSAQGLCNADRCRCFTNPKISPKNQLTACEQARRRLAFLEARLRAIMRKDPSSRTPEERRFLQEVSKNPRVIQRINSSRRPRKTRATTPRRASTPRYTNFQSIQRKAPNARNSPRKSPAPAIKFVSDPKGPQFPVNRNKAQSASKRVAVSQRRRGQSPGKGVTGARQSPKIGRNPPMNTRPNPGKGGPKASSPKFRQQTPGKRQDGNAYGNNRNSQPNPPRRNGVAQSPKKGAPTPKQDPKRGGSPKNKQKSPKGGGPYGPTSKDTLPPPRGRPGNDHKARGEDKFQESPPSGYGGQKEQARPQNAGRGGGGGGGRVPTPGKGVNGGGKSPGAGKGAGYGNRPEESDEDDESKEEGNNGGYNGGGRIPGNNGQNGGRNGGGRTPGNGGYNGGPNGGGKSPYSGTGNRPPGGGGGGNNPGARNGAGYRNPPKESDEDDESREEGNNGGYNGGGRIDGNNGQNGGRNGGGRTPGNGGYNGGGKSPGRPHSAAGNRPPGGGGGGNYHGAGKGAPYGNSGLTSSEEINSKEDYSSESGGYGGNKNHPHQTGPAKTNPRAPATTPNSGNQNGNGKDGTRQNPYRTPSRPNSQSGKMPVDSNTGQTVPPNRVLEDPITGKQEVVPPGSQVVTDQKTGEQIVVPAGSQVTHDAKTGDPVVVPPGHQIDPLTGHTFLPNHTAPKPVITEDGACPVAPGNHQDPPVPPHNKYENPDLPPQAPGHHNQNVPPPVPEYQKQNGPQLDEYGRPIPPPRDDYPPRLDEYGRPIPPPRDDYPPRLDEYGRPIPPPRDDYPKGPQLDEYGRPIPPPYEDPRQRRNRRYEEDDQYGDEFSGEHDDPNDDEYVDPDTIDPNTLSREDREIWRQMKRDKEERLRAEAAEYERAQRYQNNNQRNQNNGPEYPSNNQRHQNNNQDYDRDDGYAGNGYGGNNKNGNNQGGYQRNRDY
nr:PREDICTED: collagen alpha-1(III) chain-like [Bemisia tabaci]